MNPSATTARVRSLAIMIFLRSKRSSSTPASGPMVIAGIARDSITPMTTRPEFVSFMASANTAILLKLSPISLTTWPIHSGAIVAVLPQELKEIAHQLKRRMLHGRHSCGTATLGCPSGCEIGGQRTAKSGCPTLPGMRWSGKPASSMRMSESLTYFPRAHIHMASQWCLSANCRISRGDV